MANDFYINLPVEGGGGGGTVTDVTASSPLASSGGTTPNISLTGIVPVANGGTSLATLTLNNVILGNGTSAPLFVAPGTSGNVLTSNGTTWTSATPAASGVTTMGAFGSSPNSNAGTISGNTLTLQPADGSNPGGVSTTTQSFAGAKTFGSSVTTVGSVLASVDGTPSIGAAGANRYASAFLTTSLVLGTSTTHTLGTASAGFTMSGSLVNGPYLTMNGASSGVFATALEVNNSTVSSTWDLVLGGSVADFRHACFQIQNGNGLYPYVLLSTRANGVAININNTAAANGVASFQVVQGLDFTNIGGTTTANASTTITGSGTRFLSDVAVGERISLSSASGTYATVTAIASNTSLTVASALGNGTSQTINVKRCVQKWSLQDGTPVGIINDLGIWKIGAGTAQDLTAYNGNVIVPSQSGQSGKFLTTDGTNSSWSTVPSLSTQAVSSNITLADGKVYLVNTSAARSLQLPTPANNMHFYIKDVTGTANANNISVLQHASETIEGVAATLVLSTNYGSWEFWSDGTNWWLL